MHAHCPLCSPPPRPPLPPWPPLAQDGGVAMKEAAPTPAQTVDDIRAVVNDARAKAAAPQVRARWRWALVCGAMGCASMGCGAALQPP